MNKNFIESLKQNKFLPAAWHHNKPRWYDSDELFLKNLKTQPEDWYYRTASVNYTLNTQGYRAPDFDSIDWKNSVVMFGCSQLFGTGVDDSDTVTSQLSRIINRPVINMGVCGSSVMFAYHNSIILKNICPEPYAVIHMWTNFDRGVHYAEYGINHCGVWNFHDVPYSREWTVDSTHAATHAVFVSSASKHLWKETKFYEFSMFEETASLLGCDIIFVPEPDLGRDLSHSGKNSLGAIAKHLADKLF